MQMHFRKPFCYASCVWSHKRKNKRKVFQTCFENEQKRSFNTKTHFESKSRQNRQQSAIFVWSHKRKNKRKVFQTCFENEQKRSFFSGADDGNRTRDLRLTKATLYRLSHISTNQMTIFVVCFVKLKSITINYYFL